MTVTTRRALIRTRNAARRLAQAIEALRPQDIKHMSVTTRLAASAARNIAGRVERAMGEILGA
jgi:hypothetical protein